MKHEINQTKVDNIQRLHDAYNEALANGSVRYRSTHTTPDGTRWDLVLEPQDKGLLGQWSYLGIATMRYNPDYHVHTKFDLDRVNWDKLTPEDMLRYIKLDLDREWVYETLPHNV